MKYLSFLFFLIFAMSCDPIVSVYLKNGTGNKVKVTVKYENNFQLRLDSVIYTNENLDNYRTLRRDLFKGKIPVKNLDNNVYYIEIENY
jgi:hypothetical protein